MPDLTIAVAQSIARPGDLPRSVNDHARLASLAAEHGARVVLFPELSLTGYDRGLTSADALRGSEAALRPLREIADRRNIVIVAGAPVLSPAGLHIGALSFIPGGAVEIYQKRFLHDGEDVAFQPGAGGAPLRVDDQRLGLAICADITRAEHAREAAAAGCAIYAAGCFITEAGYDTDAGLLRGYAQAHAMTVMMANYGAPLGQWSAAGQSAIWAADGALLACAPPKGESVVIAARSSSGWSGRVVECPWPVNANEKG